MQLFDCQLMEVPQLDSASEVIAATNSKIAELVKDGWTMIGHTLDDDKTAIWTRPKAQKLWRVEKTSGEAIEAIIVAEDEDEVKSQAGVACMGYHYDEYHITEIDINDRRNYGSLLVSR